MPTALLGTDVLVSVLNQKGPMHAPAVAALGAWETQGAEPPLSAIVWAEILTGTLLPSGHDAAYNLTRFRDGFFSVTVPVCLDIAALAAELRAEPSRPEAGRRPFPRHGGTPVG